LDKIAHRFDVLNKLAFKTGTAMDLYLGAEIMLLPELPQKIKEDKRPGTYIGKRYAPRGIVKFSLPDAFSSLVKMVGKTKAVGIVFSTPSKVIN